MHKIKWREIFMQFESRHGHNSSPIYQKLIIACPHERDTIFLNTLCKSTQGLYQAHKKKNWDMK
jgi:hypothetical protein